jgi:hypothetical protein
MRRSEAAAHVVPTIRKKLRKRKEKTASLNPLPDGLNPFPPLYEKAVM